MCQLLWIKTASFSLEFQVGVYRPQRFCTKCLVMAQKCHFFTLLSNKFHTNDNIYKISIVFFLFMQKECVKCTHCEFTRRHTYYGCAGLTGGTYVRAEPERNYCNYYRHSISPTENILQLLSRLRYKKRASILKHMTAFCGNHRFARRAGGLISDVNEAM